MILLEQDLIFQHDIENKVCPILLALSAPDSDDDCKAEALSVSPRGPPRNWACARMRASDGRLRSVLAALFSGTR